MCFFIENNPFGFNGSVLGFVPVTAKNGFYPGHQDFGAERFGDIFIHAQTEAQKAQMDLEKTAIQLDTTKVKSAAEITKAVAGIQNGGMKNED